MTSDTYWLISFGTFSGAYGCSALWCDVNASSQKYCDIELQSKTRRQHTLSHSLIDLPLNGL